MKESDACYITTTIPYVNADPHIGFALEVVQADILARYHRLLGHEVFFNQGADEHGQKIWESAQKAGEDVQSYVDRYAASVRKLKETLNLSNDTFIRTTDPAHKAAAQELWRRCDAHGDIYKKKYRGLYCVGCEKFLTERDLEDGRCPLHPHQKPIELEEENYFFKFSNYQAYLEEYLKRPDIIVPKHRLEEARQFVQRGLEDFSISREKEKLPWGVPVPGDNAQTMYVWFDALTNYISTLGWPEDRDGMYKKFWEEGHTLQMAGKDQIRFQSIMWQAMLKSAGLPATDQIFYHGFITSGGQRMSKSLGNVISPVELVEKYGVDATRFQLLRNVHPYDDTDITWERLDEWYDAYLVKGLGNLTARIMKLAETYLSEPVPLLSDAVSTSDTSSTLKGEKYIEFISKFRLDRLVDDIVVLRVNELDARITKDEPFNLIKTDKEKAKKIIKELVQDLYTISVLLEPFMPDTAEKIKESVRTNKKPETLFPRM